MDNISIIIRNKNEAEYIGFAIQSCIEFFDNPEIIVLNNNSRDDSMDVVQNFNNRTSIITKNIDNYRPGKSINAGVQLSSNDYVLVMSGHTQIINLNFQKIKDQLETYKAIFGKQIPVFRGKKNYTILHLVKLLR
ncbi:MAG: glycosyltransferase family 2 protein [Flavobacteriaceae bacterium]